MKSVSRLEIDKHPMKKRKRKKNRDVFVVVFDWNQDRVPKVY